MSDETRNSVPPEAEAEILSLLRVRSWITSEDISEILQRHGVSGDLEALQKAYRKKLGQRIVASIRDEEGRRAILASNGGKYITVDRCDSRRELRGVRRRIQNHINGLDDSMKKVGARLERLDFLIAQFGGGSEE